MPTRRTSPARTKPRFSSLEAEFDLVGDEDFEQWLDAEFDNAMPSSPPVLDSVLELHPDEDYAAEESDEEAERRGLAARRAASAALSAKDPNGNQREFRRLVEGLNARHQEYIDSHFGEVYRTGDDEVLDELHARRLTFFGDLIPDAREFPKAYAVWQAWFESEQQHLQHPEVRSRLTTQQRRARGFGDTKQLD